MNKLWLWMAATAVLAMALAGCTGSSADKRDGPADAEKKAAGKSGSDEAEIEAALDKLSPEDRRLAEAQKFCAVQNDNRLGSMGTPVKVLVNDQPVFLCCKGCRQKALADPDKTLAKVKELKAKAAEGPSK